MTLLKGRIARLVVLGTSFIVLSGLPAYAAAPWDNGNHQGWGNNNQAQNSCNSSQDGRQGRPQGRSCGWNGNQNGNQSNGGWFQNGGVYPPGQVNGMSWQAAGYSPEQAWAVYSGPGGGANSGAGAAQPTQGEDGSGRN